MSGRLDNLAILNWQFETTGQLPDEIWHAWLWGTDPEEACAPEVMLNRNQLLGVLICRYRHRNSVGWDELPSSCGRMALMDKQPCEMSFRELKDTIANLQFEWPPFVARLRENKDAQGNLTAVVDLIEACTARFGAFCDGYYKEDMLDDMADVRKATHTTDELTLTPGAIRRCVGTLLILFRHIHLLSAYKLAEKGKNNIKLSHHHHEASMSDFYTWYMHYQVPVGAKLCYKHDFPGMYNHVSQPVYFHNPLFTRVMRRPLDDPDQPAIHVLPSLCQIYPEVPVRFEEECIDVTKDNGWYWLLVSGRVYLVAPGPLVLYADDARDLMGVYVEWVEKRNGNNK